MKYRPAYLTLVIAGIVIVATLSITTLTNSAGQSDAYDWKRVEQAMGKTGEKLPGGVFKVALPRSEPQVTIGDVRLSPGMALDSWVSFVRMGDEAMMMGDIVLTSDELGRVQKRLSKEGIDITAVHNTLIGESPQVYDMHISGQGDPAEMAAKIRSALDQAGISYENEKTSHMAPGQTERIDSIIGYRSLAENGIYVYEVPRAERITEDGMEIPPTMDVSTILKFQPIGDGKAAITGDFILRADEVKPVMKALNDNGIVVTALHMHMLTEEPRLFMMHFWATGEDHALAKGLHQALDKTNSAR
jgi:hypothetical protein